MEFDLRVTAGFENADWQRARKVPGQSRKDMADSGKAADYNAEQRFPESTGGEFHEFMNIVIRLHS